MTATYNNTQTNEVYELAGVKNISQAWKYAKIACSRMNWNIDMFAEDVKVSVK